MASPARAGTDDVCVDRDGALGHRANVAPTSTVIGKRGADPGGEQHAGGVTPSSVPTPHQEGSGAAPNMFTRERIGEGGAARVATLVALLDAQEQQPAVRRLRDWAFEALAPQPGESVVDVGAGTGTELRRLAEAVAPDGRAVGIEPNPGLREEASRRAALTGSAATLMDGDAADLPFADGAVHVLRCERVFQHLPTRRLQPTSSRASSHPADGWPCWTATGDRHQPPRRPRPRPPLRRGELAAHGQPVRGPAPAEPAPRRGADRRPRHRVGSARHAAACPARQRGDPPQRRCRGGGGGALHARRPTSSSPTRWPPPAQGRRSSP